MSFSKLMTAVAVLALPLAAHAESPIPSQGFDLPKSEIVKLIQEIESQGYIGRTEISIDSLRHVGDKPAYDAAIDAISARLQTAIYELSELKRQVIRYSVIVNQANMNAEKVSYVTAASSKISQEHYEKSLWAIAGSYEDEGAVLAKCVSEVCVIEITDAFEELTRFSAQIDRGIDFRKMNSSKELFWRFDRPILKASFSKTFRAMIPDNADQNAYVVLAAGLFTPVSVAGVTTVDLLKTAGSAIFNPRYRNIKLSVDRLNLDYGKIEDSHKELFRTNYTEAANGSRLAKYEADHPESSPAPTPATPAVPSLSESERTGRFDGTNRPELSDSYWMDKVEGSTQTQKEACASAAVRSARGFYAQVDAMKAAADRTQLAMAEVNAFVGSLSDDQKKEITNYKNQYDVFSQSGRSTDDVGAYDSKMYSYLMTLLKPNFDQSVARYNKTSCGYDYSGNANTNGMNVSPLNWAKSAALSDGSDAHHECSRYVSYNYSTEYGIATSLTNVFIEIRSGAAKFWACDREQYQGGFVFMCSSVDLLSGKVSGASFGTAIIDPMIKDLQGKDWLGGTPEDFVRRDVTACFSESAPAPSVPARPQPAKPGTLPPADKLRRGD